MTVYVLRSIRTVNKLGRLIENRLSRPLLRPVRHVNLNGNRWTEKNELRAIPAYVRAPSDSRLIRRPKSYARNTVAVDRSGDDCFGRYLHFRAWRDPLPTNPINIYRRDGAILP